MRLKGLTVFRDKLPWYSGKKIYIFLIITFATLAFSFLFQIFMFIFPRSSSDNQLFKLIMPFTPIVGSGFILTLGFFLVYTFWHQKSRFLKQDKAKAYQKALPIALVGISLVISYVIHSILPYNFVFKDINRNQLSWYLNVPLNEIFFNTPVYFIIFRIIVSVIFAIVGFLIIFRSLFFFGIDYMALVYVYYPEESKIVNNEIYSVLRHPTYHGLVLILIGGIFLKFSFNSIIFFLTFLLAINFHLRFVEEKELLRRFGEEYKEYRKKVPALFFSLRNFRKYLSFLFHGSNRFKHKNSKSLI